VQPVTGTFLSALRQPHSVYVRVDAIRDGATVASDLPVEGGQVTVDSGSRVRRTCSLSLAPDDGLWDALAPAGTELLVQRGIRYPNGQVESVQLGAFVIDVQSLGYSPSGRLTLTAPDRWVKVQRARFEVPLARGGEPVTTEMAMLLASTGGVSHRIVSPSFRTLPFVTWERERDKALFEMAQSIGAEVFLGADGVAVVRNVPSLTSQPSVWTVDASAAGVLLDASRERNRQRTYNVVVVTSEAVDGQVPFPPQIVADEDPRSPTWVGGPFGRVPYFYSSPLLTNAAQAEVAGRAILDRVRGLAAQLTLEAIVNPALDAGDVIDVLLPPRGRGLPRAVERHLVDGLTIPLTVDGSQSITTRSSRPDESEGQ